MFLIPCHPYGFCGGLVRGFNPLNQVYVFNTERKTDRQMGYGFNPLNQVYVFNNLTQKEEDSADDIEGFNPLNQVYVFNLRG